MLTLTNPQHTAEDAAEAMRNLVFATRSFAEGSVTPGRPWMRPPCSTSTVRQVPVFSTTTRRTAPSPSRVARRAKVRTSAAACGSGKRRLGDIRPKLSATDAPRRGV